MKVNSFILLKKLRVKTIGNARYLQSGIRTENSGTNTLNNLQRKRVKQVKS